jgi:hypothetical protein
MANLDARTQIARADVQRVGDWSRTGRLDPALNPLIPPMVNVYAPPTPPPSPPDEQTLRTQLQVANEHREDLAAKLRAAEETLSRAQRHVEHCRQALARFASLDERVTQATMAQLRSDGSVELPDELRQAMRDRDMARVDVAASERAAEAFLRERAQLSSQHGDAVRAADALINKVLAFRADAIAHECLDLESRIAQRRVALLAFDRVATPQRIGMSFEILHVLGQSATRPLKHDELQLWARAASQLREDAMVALDIALPPAEPVYVRGRPFPPVKPPSMQDDGDPHLVEQEQAS